MSDEPQYRMVDGELVPLTPEEIAELGQEATDIKRQEALSQPKFDMGKSMHEILTG